MKKLIVAASLLLTLSMCKYKEYSSLRSSVETLQELEKQNDEIRVKITQLENDIEAIKNNKLYQERVIREELGWVRKGDLIIDFCAAGSCGKKKEVIGSS